MTNPNKYLMLDVETTSLTRDAFIWQIAGQVYEFENGGVTLNGKLKFNVAFPGVILYNELWDALQARWPNFDFDRKAREFLLDAYAKKGKRISDAFSPGIGAQDFSSWITKLEKVHRFLSTFLKEDNNFLVCNRICFDVPRLEYNFSTLTYRNSPIPYNKVLDLPSMEHYSGLKIPEALKENSHLADEDVLQQICRHQYICMEKPI